MSRPLSWSMRFALALSAVFAIGALSAGGLSYVFLSHEMYQRLGADAQASAESLAHLADAGDRADLEEQIAAQVRSARNGASLFAFVDAKTGVTIGSLHLDAPFEGQRRLVAGRDIPEGSETAPEPAESYLAYGIRTDIGWVIAARDEAWVAESGEILVQTTISALGLALLLSIGLALFIARRNERRIDAMERVLDAVGAGQLESRIGDRGNDDLSQLAQRVDQMLSRLETGFDAIRQVSTDVAHDLRAPLARLRMRLEPQAVSPKVPDDTRHEIGSALIDIDAIAGTFDAILRLARLQSGPLERRSDPVDLTQLANDVCEILGASAEEAGHALRNKLPDTPLFVQGDADLLTQALTNLVGNAIQHCPPPAKVTIGVTLNNNVPVLFVEDDGPGIPEPDQARALQRFVRLDNSRSVPGTGLGLSLVAAIADLHHARLVLEDNGPGLRVSFWFPRMDTKASNTHYATPATAIQEANHSLTFISSAKQWARNIKRDVVALWLAARDPRVPWYAKAVAGGVAAYALSPIDLIPDFIPIIGYLDDLIILPLGIMLAVKLVPPDLLAEFRAAATRREKPTSKAGLAFIVAVWIVAAVALAWFLWPVQISN